MNTMPNLTFLGKHSGRDYAVRGVRDIPDYIVEEAIKEVYGEEKFEELLDYRRSEVSVPALNQDFMRGDEAEYIKVDFKHPSFIYAAERTYNDFHPGKILHPVHYRECRNYDFPETTSAEEPYRTGSQFDGWSKKKGACKEHCFTTGMVDLHRIKDGETVRIYDILANARSHLVKSDEEDKVRMVFGYPFRELTFEAMWYWPYYSAITKKKSHITMWGREMYNGGMRHIHTLATTGELFICLDYKQFDKRLLSQIIDWCFETLYSYFDVTTYHEDANGVERPATDGPVRLRRAFEHVKQFFMHGPVRLPGRDRYRRVFAGVPSGSVLTQLIGTMANTIITYAIFHETFGDGPEWLRVLGDDSAAGIYYCGDLTDEEIIDKLAETAWNRFRMVINRKKSIITRKKNEIHMLGYINRNGYPWREEDELLARLLHPEGLVDDDEARAGRAVGIAWAALGQHPLLAAACRKVLEKTDTNTFNLREYKYLLSDIIGVTNPTNRIPTTDELVGRLMGVNAD